MGEIRNARCLFLQIWWLQYADHRVDPICRSWPGSITAIMRWILYADHQVAPLGRSLTAFNVITLPRPKPRLDIYIILSFQPGLHGALNIVLDNWHFQILNV